MLLCYKCGIPIQPKLMNLCDRCLSTEISLSSKIKKHMFVEHCRSCDRYLTPPKNWSAFTWGSRELLIYLIKRNSSLEKYEIIDTNFVYTEEHSKRMRISVTIQECGIREDIEIEYVIRNKQCSDCEKVEAKQYWKYLVQIRHKPKHKRLFIYLEQMLIKNKLFAETSNIKQRPTGVDFYYLGRNSTLKMVNFLQSVLPVKVVSSERLISKDVQNARSNYKFTYSVEIAPFCKDDLVVIDKSYADSLGVGRVLLVEKVCSTITFFDFMNLRSIRINSNSYWLNKDKFYVLMSSKDFVSFDIVEIDTPLLKRNGFKLSHITVLKEDVLHETKTHLASLINDSDRLMGYDLTNYNSPHKTDDVPNIVLVRKEANKNVSWKSNIEATEIDDEYYYFIEDIKRDKEMLESICEVTDPTNDLSRGLDMLGLHL